MSPCFGSKTEIGSQVANSFVAQTGFLTDSSSLAETDSLTGIDSLTGNDSLTGISPLTGIDSPTGVGPLAGFGSLADIDLLCHYLTLTYQKTCQLTTYQLYSCKNLKMCHYEIYNQN